MNWKRFAALGAVLSLLFLLTNFLTRSCGSTPPTAIRPGNHQPITVLREFPVNGTRQWVLIRGSDVKNPLLLYLAGGPGLSEMAWTRQYLYPLEDFFTIVTWDQRGMGKSAATLATNEDLTLETVLSDTLSLVSGLTQEFSGIPLVLAAHGTATIPAMLLVRDHPELFRAYIGIGQMVSPGESDRLLYADTFRAARRKNDTNTLSQLATLGSPPYTGSNIVERYGTLSRLANSYFASDYPLNVYRTNWIRNILTASEYSSFDRRNYWPSHFRVFSRLYPRLAVLDLRKEVNGVRVPVLFVNGRYDRSAPPGMTAQFVSRLRAPRKKFLIFENSGNSPPFEEPDHFLSVVTQNLLPLR